MIKLFIDIDNTLIYSHRRSVSGEKICVERIKGEIQSCMTMRTYGFFTEQTKFEVIPVSTRNMAQYGRLAEMTERMGVETAVICNGGILLRNGEPDSEWLAETHGLIGDSAAELEKAAEIMKSLSTRAVHEVEKIMVYTVADEPELMREKLAERLDIGKITVFTDSRKVYCIPSVINKGSAVRRYLKRFGSGFSVGAGDGFQDISMLETVDLPIAHRKIFDMVKNPKKICGDTSENFSDSVCEILEKINPESAE